MQVVVIALEHRVRFEVDLDVEVSRRAAIDPGFTLSTETNPVALVDAHRNLD
jgi:hypothetical protein